MDFISSLSHVCHIHSYLTRVPTSRPLLTLKWGKLRAFSGEAFRDLWNLNRWTRQVALHCLCGEMDASEPMARTLYAGLMRGDIVVADGPDEAGSRYRCTCSGRELSGLRHKMIWN